MGGKSSRHNERVEYGRHEEVGDAPSRVTEAGGECISGADDVLVEEPGRPDLTRNESSTKDANKEAEGKEAFRVCNSAGKNSRNGACEKATGKGISGSKAIT